MKITVKKNAEKRQPLAYLGHPDGLHVLKDGYWFLPVGGREYKSGETLKGSGCTPLYKGDKIEIEF